jgi:general secretion pathway protein D
MRSQVSLEFDPALLSGGVGLRLPAGVSDEQLWALMHQVLAQRGLTTVRLSGATSLSLVRSTDAAALASVEVSPAAGLSATPFQPGFSARAIVLRSGQVRAALDALRPLLSKGVGSANPLGESGVIVVADYSAKLEEVLRVLDGIEAPKPSGVTMESVVLKHAKPSALVSLLGQVTTKQQAVGAPKVPGEFVASDADGTLHIIAPTDQLDHWKQLIARFDSSEPVETHDYQPQAFAIRDVASLLEEYLASLPTQAESKPTIVLDELTGTLIITATPSQHDKIRSLLARLDSAQTGPLPLRAFPIRNRPVRELLRTLEDLIDAGALSSQSLESDSAPASVRQSASQTTLRDLRTGTAPLLPTNPSNPAASSRASEKGPRLTADESTNTLIAVAEARVLRQVEELLTMLDVRQPQVMLEVLLVSMTETEAVNVGVELERLGTLNDATYKLASLFGLSTSNNNGSRNVGDAAGFSGAVLNPGEFSAVVRALPALNLGRSVSTPRVLVSNNEQATFSSVFSQPFVRTDTTNSTATSSFGGSDSAGTTISVRPQIAQGDHLVLTYSINLSSFVGTPAAAGLPPPKQQTNVDSVATIPDSHIIAVGGLDLTSQSSSTSQVPLLGDVPLLGELFKSRSRGTSRNKFFAFIRASVLRSETFDDLRFQSLQAADAAALPNDWPIVEPMLLEPMLIEPLVTQSTEHPAP